MTDPAQEALRWLSYTLAAIGIFVLALVCLVKRAGDFDQEQMSVTVSEAWEPRGTME